MKKYLPVLLLFLLSSCATIFNGPYTIIKVDTNLDSTIVRVNDNPTEFVAPAIVPVKRSKYDLVLKLQNDSINKTVLVPRKLSPAFTIGNLFGAGLYGYIIDLTNPKRFGYPSDVFIDMVSGEVYENYSYTKPKGGAYFLTFNIPLVNQFYVFDGESYYPHIGAWGFGCGLEYYQSSEEYFSIQVSSALGIREELPPDENLYRQARNTNSIQISLRQNFRKEKWHYGIGPSYIGIVQRNYKQFIGTSSTQINQGIGLSVAGSRQLTKRVYVGVEYNPLLITRNRFKTLDYQHSISLKLGLKFRVGAIK